MRFLKKKLQAAKNGTLLRQFLFSKFMHAQYHPAVWLSDWTEDGPYNQSGIELYRQCAKTQLIEIDAGG